MRTKYRLFSSKPHKAGPQKPEQLFPDGRTAGSPVRLAILCAAVGLLTCCAVYGQEFRATISGAILDPAGAVIPNAKVVATEINTGTRVQTVSDAAGQYALPFLAPGDYDVSVEAAGFKEVIRKGVHVGAGDHQYHPALSHVLRRPAYGLHSDQEQLLQ